MTDLRIIPMLDKTPWVLRQTPTTSSEPSTSNRTVPQTEGRVGDYLHLLTEEITQLTDITEPNSLDESKPSRPRSPSDASSESDDKNHLSAEHFDILIRDDVGEFNLKDGFSQIQNLPPPPNTTEPIPGKKHTAAFEMGNNRCMYRWSHLPLGWMAWERFRAFRRQQSLQERASKMRMSGSSFRGDLLDDYGAPLMRLYLGNNDGCTDQCVSYWANMNETTPGLTRRGFRVSEIAKRRAFEEMDE